MPDLKEITKVVNGVTLYWHEPWGKWVTIPEDQPPMTAGETEDVQIGCTAISADIENKRVLKLHFDHEVTDADRQRLVDAENALRASLRPASPLAMAGEVDKRELVYRYCSKLKVSEKRDVAAQIGVPQDISLHNAARDHNFLHAVYAADKLDDLAKAVNAICPSPAALSTPTAQVEREAVEDLWQELVEMDDRTSPEEYPDHALINREEFIEFCNRAARPAALTRDQAVEAAREKAVVKAFDMRAWDVVSTCADNLEDEGDRVYLGSTNHADLLKEYRNDLFQACFLRTAMEARDACSDCGKKRSAHTLRNPDCPAYVERNRAALAPASDEGARS